MKYKLDQNSAKGIVSTIIEADTFQIAAGTDTVTFQRLGPPHDPAKPMYRPSSQIAMFTKVISVKVIEE